MIFDTSGALAESLKPKRTPEAFVLDRAGAVRDRGRIDDRFPGTPTNRTRGTRKPTMHDRTKRSSASRR
jgi:hypothetical protein